MPKNKGFNWTFPVGIDKDFMQFVIAEDDGTWGNHLIIKFNNIPCGVIPFCDKRGLEKIVETLIRILGEYEEQKLGSSYERKKGSEKNESQK